jgi:hypothetical protein
MYVHWLDEIEDYRLDVTHLQGSRNPTDQLSRRGFTDGKCQAPSTGDAEEESQQELFLLLGRDAPVPARLAAVHAPWAANRQAAAATFADTVQGGGALPSVSPRGGGALFRVPPHVLCSSHWCGAPAWDRDYDGPVEAVLVAPHVHSWLDTHNL